MLAGLALLTADAMMLLILILLVGLILVRRGWVGDLVDRDPRCAKCGYNLVGQPTTSTRCPECGNDLTERSHVRIGLRRRRRWALVSGLALLMIGAAPLSREEYQTALRTNWNPWKPAWLLQRQLFTAKGADIVAIQQELQKRLEAGSVSESARRELVNNLLARQADRSKPWFWQFSEVIEALHKSSSLSPAQIAQYARNHFQYTVTLRSRVRRGDDLPFEVTQSPGRGSRSYQYTVEAEIRFPNSPPIGRGQVLSGRHHDGGGFSESHGGQAKLNSVLGSLQDGKQEVVVVIHEEVSCLGRIEKCVKEIPATFVLLPAAEPSTELVTDPSIGEALRQGVRFKEIVILSDNPIVQMRFTTDALNVGVSAKSFLRQGEKEWEFVRLMFSPGLAVNATTGRQLDDFMPVGLIDIILRPLPGPTTSTTRLDRVWNEELVFKDVPVIYQDSR